MKERPQARNRLHFGAAKGSKWVLAKAQHHDYFHDSFLGNRNRAG